MSLEVASFAVGLRVDGSLLIFSLFKVSFGMRALTGVALALSIE